jgi:hypothetical protein
MVQTDPFQTFASLDGLPSDIQAIVDATFAHCVGVF